MLLPGIRIGYVISDSKHHQRILRVKQSADISTSGLNQRAIHLMLERGVMSQQLERNNREFRRRRDVAVVAARKHFPPGTQFRTPQGGLYLWVRFPNQGPTAAELVSNGCSAWSPATLSGMCSSPGRPIRIRYA
ncbi:MAG: aminotransferase class I/II-fold pyridoxal phosphate-dependent enzyme [Chloroflexi bacterium]|nr:aminotransferase class I/II-fold pyridoxal phosphate-dependent enzyme [Chloroflexota bacterium]